MLSSFTILFFVIYLPFAYTTPITIYQDARFNPIDNHFMITNLSAVKSQDACNCQCYMNALCITATYNGHSQYCSLYFAEIQEGQLELMTKNANSSVISFKNKIISAPSILNSPNETVNGIWNTTVGGNSSISLTGYSTGDYYPGESPMAVFDDIIATNYNSYGDCNNSTSTLSCGTNTGFYVTLKNGVSLLRAFRIRSGHYSGARDPLTITLEGSNKNGTLLTLGSSWTLIYSGSSGLTTNMSRNELGQIQMINNNSVWYTSYRLLVSSKVGNEFSVEYSEVQFLGY